MDRDRGLGFLVFVVAAVVVIGYSYYALLLPAFGNFLAVPVIDPYWVLAFPLWVTITVVLLIGAWIGWTLFTTPPPVPIEKFEGLEDFSQEPESLEES